MIRAHATAADRSAAARWSRLAAFLALVAFACFAGACGGPTPAQRADADTAAARAAESLAPAVVRGPAMPSRAAPAIRPRAAVAAAAPPCRVQRKPGERATDLWNADGTVTTRKYGSTATVWARCDTVVLVGAPPPPPPPPAVTVAVTTQVASMQVPTTQQAFATVTRGGVVDTSATLQTTLQWGYGPAAVCGPQGDGTAPSRVRALGAGTCTVTARDAASGVSGSTTVAVTAPPPAPAPPPPADTAVDTAVVVPPPPSGARVDGAAELPRASFPLPSAAQLGPALRTVRVATAAALAAALADMRAGDRILLSGGATYSGNFTTPGVGGPGYAVVETEGAALPAAGDTLTEAGRVTEAQRATFARVVTPNASAALTCLPGAEGVVVRGVDFGATAPFLYNVVTCGSHEVPDAAQLPRRVAFDRVAVTVGDGTDVARCLALSAAGAYLGQSRLTGCHGAGRDAQAVNVVAGGPLTIRNNHLAGAGENVMVGGADPRAPAMVPHDIEVSRNLLTKPDAWQGSRWTIKNLLELKTGVRVRVEHNVLENNWAAAQGGTAVVVNATNQECTAPWSKTSDVAFRANVIRRSPKGINVAGRPNDYRGAGCRVDSALARVTVAGNTWAVTGAPWLEVEGVADLTVDGNAAVATAAGGVQFNSGVSPRFRFVNDTVRANPYGDVVSSADGHGRGQGALDYHAPGAAWHGVAVVGPYNPAGLPRDAGAPAGPSPLAVALAAAGVAAAGGAAALSARRRKGGTTA